MNNLKVDFVKNVDCHDIRQAHLLIIIKIIFKLMFVTIQLLLIIDTNIFQHFRYKGINFEKNRQLYTAS